MSDERKTSDEQGAGSDENGGGDGGKAGGAQGRMGDGIRQGIGVLSAFKDALEETIQEARERGDLSSDRAREVMKETLAKAQTAAEGARERLDFANQAEMEAVRSAIDTIRDRVGALEESVFGAAKDAGNSKGEAPGDDEGVESEGEA